MPLACLGKHAMCFRVILKCHPKVETGSATHEEKNILQRKVCARILLDFLRNEVRLKYFKENVYY